jgi:hypothetical protein
MCIKYCLGGALGVFPGPPPFLGGGAWGVAHRARNRFDAPAGRRPADARAG